MNYAQLIAHYRRPADAAKALGVDRRTVDSWKSRRIPSNQQMKAELDSGGVLQVDEQAKNEAQEMAAYLEKSSEIRA